MIIQALAALFLGVSGATPTPAAPEVQELRLPVSVGEPELCQGEEGDTLTVAGFGTLPASLGPPLPARVISIALPPGSEVVSVSYQGSQETRVPGVVRLRSPRVRPWRGAEPADFQGSARATVELVRRSAYRGFELVDVRVSPFRYEAGQLSYSKEVEVIVRYRPPDRPAPATARESPAVEATARSIIANWEQARVWYPALPAATTERHTFVVITLDALTDAVAPLVSWEREKGRTVAVVTTSEIAASCSGVDLAEKIRSFLRERYPATAWGIEYVLIVGHPTDIPMRRVWSTLPGEPRPETDFYYAELSLPDSQSWDSNRNRRYAENLDNVDLYGEVNVGRIPWSDVATVASICAKSVAFERASDPSYKRNMLVLGAIVDPHTDGAVFQERIVDPITHPWMSQWTVTRLYERSSTYPSDLPLNRANTVATWASGHFAVVSWHSHGSPTGAYAGGSTYFQVEDCEALDDRFPAIVSAASCSGSDTDYFNVGQALMRQGAVGFLGANKAAYYMSGWDDPGDGSDQSLKYLFLTELLSERRTQGQAHQHALQEMYRLGLWHFPVYEACVHGSLWGNPDLGLSSQPTDRPPDPPAPVEGPRVVLPGTVGIYTVVAVDPEGGDVTIALDWGDGEEAWTGPHHSGVPVTLSHQWPRSGTFQVSAKARDLAGNVSAWSEPLTVACGWRVRRRIDP